MCIPGTDLVPREDKSFQIVVFLRVVWTSTFDVVWHQILVKLAGSWILENIFLLPHQSKFLTWFINRSIRIYVLKMWIFYGANEVFYKVQKIKEQKDKRYIAKNKREKQNVHFQRLGIRVTWIFWSKPQIKKWLYVTHTRTRTYEHKYTLSVLCIQVAEGKRKFSKRSPYAC